MRCSINAVFIKLVSYLHHNLIKTLFKNKPFLSSKSIKRLNIVAVVGLVVELLEREEAVTRGEEVRLEGMAGVLPITMVLRHQSHKHTLFR